MFADNEDVPALDIQIDELYQRPLGEFTTARNTLAKTLSGDDARQVKQLKKPTVVPWAINQLYWRARPLYDRLVKAGQALRSAQIAALKGKDIDVRRATETHRKALADAIERAMQLAESEGSHPGPELPRMLEALSLAADEPDHPGRFTDIVPPAGFEALTGITPVVRPGPARRTERAAADLKGPAYIKHGSDAKQKRDAQQHAREEAERQRNEREKAAQIRAAERRLDRARAAEAKARTAFDRARDEVRAAEQTLAAARVGGPPARSAKS